MFEVRQIVTLALGGIISIPVREYKEFHEAVEYAKFLNRCNKCTYIVRDGSFRVLYDTRSAPECLRWQEVGF